MKRLIVLFCLGGFSALAMAPANFWPALFVGLSGFYILFSKTETPLKAAVTGFVFSFSYFLFSLSWMGNALLVEGNPYWWAWPLAVCGLPVILALFTAVGCYVHKYFSSGQNAVFSYAAFVFLLALCDYARGHLFTGFPWNLYGYTWIDVLPIAQIAALHDIYLLNFLTILWAAAPGFLLIAHYQNKIKAVLAVILSASFIFGYGFGIYRIHKAPVKYHADYEAVIVQPNIKQHEKWNSDKRIENFQTHIDLSRYNPDKNAHDMTAYYIIWPETALAPDLLKTSWAISQIRDVLNSYPAKAYLITGALRYDPNTDTYFNSILTFDQSAKIIHTYNKSHLVPFGEYMPFENIFDIAPLVGFTGFEKGMGPEMLSMPEGITFSPLVCYEIIFPGKAYDNNLSSPDMIINVTNDAWYGDSAGPYQHLVQSKFRAIETGLPVLRSANTGISVLITPLGYGVADEKLSQQLSIIHKVPIAYGR